MKVAFIYDALYPEVKGGVERRLYEIGKRLAEKHEVHWYTFGWWEGETTLEREGIVIHSVGKPVPLYGDGIRNPREALIFALRLLGTDVDLYDIIDCQEFPYLHAYPSKVRFSDYGNFVITWHEYWGKYWDEYLPSGAYIAKAIEMGLIKLTPHHIAVSRHTINRLRRLRSGNFGLVPNGIDFEVIRNVEPNPELYYDALFVGRLVGHKNLGLLLRALRLILQEVPSFKVAIVGSGPQRKALMNMAQELGVQNNVDFYDPFPTFEEVVSLMKSSRVFVFPSLREGFGMVVLEANASGIPAVTVRAKMNASVDLIAEGKNGYVSGQSPADFAEKVLLAWENSSKMRRPSISIAKKYDWDNIVKKLERYYKGVVDGA